MLPHGSMPWGRFRAVRWLMTAFFRTWKSSWAKSMLPARTAWLPRSAADDSFLIPDHILVVNYFGIPVIGSVSFLARTSYVPLRKYGPNDGTVLLADMILPGGVTLMELGSDHFMGRKPLDIVTVALAITVINWLEHPDSEMVRGPAPESAEIPTRKV